MSQCAELARLHGHDDDVILAAFFHDRGHICAKYDETDNMSGYGRLSHEKEGADINKVKYFLSTALEKAKRLLL